MLHHFLDAYERNLYEEALEFAQFWHKDQKRKYTGEPYWHHLASVSAIVSTVCNRNVSMIQAAVLHDVMEDTPVGYVPVYEEFGSLVVDYVVWMTDKMFAAPKVGNRAARKAMIVAKLAKAPPQVKTIKLADIIDNSATIFEHDKNFARVFLREKVDLLPALKGGDEELFQRASRLVVEERTKLALHAGLSLDF